MYAKMFLSILGMQLLFKEVYSSEVPAPDCDRMNGPSGLTYCVQSSSYPKPQAAICLPKYEIRLSTPRHLTCKWKDAKYCWHLCSTTPSHGGMSACECDPKSTRQVMSDNINCYLPTGNNLWVLECLAKLKKCPSIEELEKKIIKWDTIALEMYDYGNLWIKAVKLCIQESLVHILYPQVFNDCETIESKIQWATEACYMEPNNEHRFCDLSWHDMSKTFNDYSFFPRHYKTFNEWYGKCAWTPVIPPWAKLLVFYLEHKTGKDIDNDILANETAKALSHSFKWNEAKVTCKAVAPDFFNKTSTSIPIRVYLYSETEDSEQIERIVYGLKTYLANREKLELFLSDDTRIEVSSLMSCSDPQCLTYELFPFKTDDPSCGAAGGKCQNQHTQCEGGSYLITPHCYESSQDKCCLTTHRDQDTGDCKDLDLPILSRDTWGAARPYEIFKLKLPMKRFFIHHTDQHPCYDTEECSKRLQGAQNTHLGWGFGDIGYSFLIGGSGQIFEGRGWKRIGAHTYNYNHNSFAAAFIGNFVNKLPTTRALNAAHKLLACGIKRGFLDENYKLYGHYDVSKKTKNTVCPGKALYNKIREWPRYQIIADRDGPCLKIGGLCWPKYLGCNGTFHVLEDLDLCEGNTERQCCVYKVSPPLKTLP